MKGVDDSLTVTVPSSSQRYSWLSLWSSSYPHTSACAPNGRYAAYEVYA